MLLADEVGLGKTIEAGLILHRLLLAGRVERALILVPDSLTHQWLVELLRRFSLTVTLLDEHQSQAHGSANPFESAQLVLASRGWLFANRHRQEQAPASRFDLLIVDEAHHLDWHPETSGPGYLCVEQLAAEIPGLLLLTATPEQMGRRATLRGYACWTRSATTTSSASRTKSSTTSPWPAPSMRWRNCPRHPAPASAWPPSPTTATAGPAGDAVQRRGQL